MIGNQIALVRRELWEHRAIFVTPAAIAVIVTPVSYTHLTLPTTSALCRCRWWAVG